MSAASPVAIVSCMRNEGIHFPEWLAHHRVIGFGLPVICSNACDDGSDDLLDNLTDQGAVTHPKNPTAPGDRPILTGIALAMDHLRGGPAEWLAHLDSREFLSVAPGAVPVQVLIHWAGAAHAIALPWRSFGGNGHADWPGETLRAFTACETAPDTGQVRFKSLFRLHAFAGASDHMPTKPLTADPIAVIAAGEPLSNTQLLGPPRSRYHPIPTALRGGTVVHHNAIRLRDVFLMKNLRGRGTGPPSNRYHLGSRWHRRANRNLAQDRSILARWPEVAAEPAHLRALPRVAEAEAACRDWFLAARARHLTAETIANWTAEPTS